jgi:hypothetical protein
MCLYHLHEETAQQFIKDNFDRRLTDKELYRMRYTFFESEDVFLELCDVIYEATKAALDNTDGQWDKIDKEFDNGINVFKDLNCKEK